MGASVRELSDDEVFGGAPPPGPGAYAELSDDDVFGASPAPAPSLWSRALKSVTDLGSDVVGAVSSIPDMVSEAFTSPSKQRQGVMAGYDTRADAPSPVSGLDQGRGFAADVERRRANVNAGLPPDANIIGFGANKNARAPRDVIRPDNGPMPGSGGYGKALLGAPGEAYRQLARYGAGMTRALAEAAGVDDLAEFSARRGRELAGESATAGELLSDKGFVSPRTVMQAGGQTIAQVPTIAATLAGVPLAPALIAGMGAPAAGQGYQFAREEGLQPLMAALYGGGQGAVEVVTELPAFKALTTMPLPKMAQLLRGDPKAIGTLAKYYAANQGIEVTTEEASTLGSWLLDKAMSDPTATLDRLGSDLKQTFQQMLVQGPMTAGAAHTMRAAPEVGRAVSDRISPQSALGRALDEAVRNTELAPTTAQTSAATTREGSANLSTTMPGAAATMEAPAAANPIIVVPPEIRGLFPQAPMELPAADPAQVAMENVQATLERENANRPLPELKPEFQPQQELSDEEIGIIPQKPLPVVAPTETRKGPAKRIEPTGILKVILKIGGIQSTEAPDVSGERAHIANRVLPRLFRKNGVALDDLASLLHQRGFMSDEEMGDVDGGVEALRQKIRLAMNKGTVVSAEGQEQLNQRLGDEREWAEAAVEADKRGIDISQLKTLDEAWAKIDQIPAIDVPDAIPQDAVRDTPITGDRSLDFTKPGALPAQQSAQPAQQRAAPAQETAPVDEEALAEAEGKAFDAPVPDFNRFIAQKHPGVVTILQEHPNGTIELKGLQVREPGERGKGHGQAVMRELVAYADLHDRGVILMAYPEDSDKMPLSKLVKWYGQFGFKPLDEQETPEATWMYRPAPSEDTVDLEGFGDEQTTDTRGNAGEIPAATAENQDRGRGSEPPARQDENGRAAATDTQAGQSARQQPQGQGADAGRGSDNAGPAGDRAQRGRDFGVDSNEPNQNNQGQAENGAGGETARGVRRDAGRVPATADQTGAQANRRRPVLHALGITERLERTGSTALVGEKVRKPADLAELAQVYRDPKLETFRLFFVKGDTIVLATAVSSRLPGTVSMVPSNKTPEQYVAWLRQQLRPESEGGVGADGYYMLHNHPSGEPTPSVADIRSTAEVAKEVPGFKGHVVIDSNKYGVIRATSDGRVIARTVEKNFGKDELLVASMPSEFLGKHINAPGTVGAIGKSCQREGWVTLIGQNDGVRAIMDVPLESIHKLARAKATIRGFARRTGSGQVFAYGEQLPGTRELIEEGFLVDFVDTKGESARENGISPQGRQRFGNEPPTRIVASEETPYNVHTLTQSKLGGSQQVKAPAITDNARDRAKAFLEASGDIPSAKTVGHVNYDTINAPEDVKRTLSKLSEVFAPMIKQSRRGEVSVEATGALANMLGQSPERMAKLLGRKIGEASNAHELVARASLMQGAAERLTELVDEVASKPTDENAAAMIAQIQRSAMMSSQFLGAAAEAGRALNILRNLASAQAQAKRLEEMSQVISEWGGVTNVQELARKLKSYDNAAQMMQFAREQARNKHPSMWIEAWKAGLLSGLQTHAANTLSNLVVLGLRVPEKAIQAIIGKVHSGEKAYLSEALAEAIGMVMGVKNAARVAWETFKSGEIPAEDKVEVRGKAITGANMGLTGKAAKTVDIIGEVVRLPFRALSTEDAFFKELNRSMTLYALATRQAINERAHPFFSRVAELVQNPTDAMRQRANEDALYFTFNKKLGPGMQFVQLALNTPGGRPFQVIVPFVRTPTNIVKFVGERTPLAVASKAVRADILAGGVARDEALAKIISGSAIGLTAMSLAGMGLLSGGGPPDRDLKRIKREAGWQPYSVKVGDTWYAYNRLEPFGMLLGIGSDLSEIWDYMHEDERDKLAVMVAMAVAQNLTNKTFLRGITDVVNAASDPGRYGDKWIQSLAGTIVPTGVAQAARVDDPIFREIESTLDVIKSRIPGLSTELPPKLDTFGEPVKREGSFGPDIMSPIATSTEKHDPVRDELVRLKLSISLPGKKVFDVQLTPAQRQEFGDLSGKTAYDVLETIITSDSYGELPDWAKKEAVEKIINRSREATRSIILPDIIDQVIDKKLKAYQ